MLGSVGSRGEELRGSMELQQHYERLVQSLEGLAVLGKERLSHQPGPELHSSAELQAHLSTHTVSMRYSTDSCCYTVWIQPP